MGKHEHDWTYVKHFHHLDTGEVRSYYRCPCGAELHCDINSTEIKTYTRGERIVNSQALKWTDGNPIAAGAAGWVWIANEDGDYAVIEIIDGAGRAPKGFGKIQAWAGPIEPPDEDSLP